MENEKQAKNTTFFQVTKKRAFLAQFQNIVYFFLQKDTQKEQIEM